MKLPQEIAEKYQVTKRVVTPRFEHSYLRLVDLEKIGPVMAEKLVGTGHLTRKQSEPVQKKKATVKSDKK